jgi:transcriptional regulator with XRE-family HTH domain
MSKDRLTGATADERRQWAARVRALRQSAGLGQTELAELAGVARQSISNMETGNATPQEGQLRRVLEVLGVELGADFEPQTEVWLGMMGSLIEAIPGDHRQPTVSSAIRVLSDGVRRSRTVDVGAEDDTAVADAIPFIPRSEQGERTYSAAALMDQEQTGNAGEHQDETHDDEDDDEGTAR